MTANIRLGSVSLDCADPRSLADFWSTLLGGEIAYQSDNVVAVQLDGMWLTAITVENYVPPTWPGDDSPKQIHLDLAVKDLAAAAEEALGLGATRCEIQPDPDTYLVFLDPAGHPFCLTTQIPD
jgi:catechol 2,3-dioxygenase-like lactoylglutathione lyase family enzyme